MAQWRDRLRQSGLRSTSARVAVLQLLEQAESPLSHAELADRLVPSGYDRATVYRNLIDMAEAGLLSRAELGDHVWRFELRREGHDDEHGAEHPHFVCVECGQVTCMHETRLKLTPPPGTKESHIRKLTEILLRGYCDRCGR